MSPDDTDAPTVAPPSSSSDLAGPASPPHPSAPMRLAGATVNLVAPSSHAARWAVVLCAQRPGVEVTVLAAALGLCWPRLQSRVPYRHDLLAYGEQVIDFLMSPERGAERVKSPAEIARAGRSAYRLCVEGLVDVEGASGFSKPPSSTSTDGGASEA